MRLVYITAENSFVCSNKGYVFFFTIFCFLFSCKGNHEKIEVWKYIQGGTELEFIDTIKQDMNYSNRFLVDILFLDSIMNIQRTITKLKSKNLNDGILLELSDQQTFVLDSQVYKLFRGDLIRSDSNNKLIFIYDEKIGVIALYTYGFGLVKLVSRSEGNRIYQINQDLYDKIDTSKILFPDLPMPDLVEYEIFNPDDNN